MQRQYHIAAVAAITLLRREDGRASGVLSRFYSSETLALVKHSVGALLELQSRFGDKLTLIPSNLSPKRDCSPVLYAGTPGIIKNCAYRTHFRASRVVPAPPRPCRAAATYTRQLQSVGTPS